MLDIQDFPGQGTALVGILDSFMDSKGLITPEKWSEFCSEVVPLVRMNKYTWTTDETFIGRVQIAHYGPADLPDARVMWTVTGSDGQQLAADAFDPVTIRQGQVFEVDTFAENLGIPNHKRELLEHCIANLRSRQNVQESVEERVRYTGEREFGDSAEAWQRWYEANRDYLFFSDCDGFRFIVDEQAKSAGKPTSEFPGWSSQEVDYRPNAVPAGT